MAGGGGLGGKRKGWEMGYPRGWEPGEIGKNFATVHNFLQ